MRTIIIRAFVPALLAIAGCASETGDLEGAIEGDAPILGAADSGDRADRQCRILLREAVPRTQPLCRSGACWHSWTVRVDVARDWAATSPTVGALYHLRSAESAPWLEVRSTRRLTSTAQFTRYELVVGQYVVPSSEPLDGAEIEVIPFLVTSDGRLFDKNRVAGDFDNYVLDASNDFSVPADDTCAGAGTVATIRFSDDWTQSVEGRIVTNGRLNVEYDADRLTECRGTHNGYRAWDITAHAYFYPGEQYVIGSVVSSSGGFYVPADAEWVDLWFTNTSIDCRGEVAYDSNWGDNYGFEVEQP